MNLRSVVASSQPIAISTDRRPKTEDRILEPKDHLRSSSPGQQLWPSWAASWLSAFVFRLGACQWVGLRPTATYCKTGRRRLAIICNFNDLHTKHFSPNPNERATPARAIPQLHISSSSSFGSSFSSSYSFSSSSSFSPEFRARCSERS